MIDKLCEADGSPSNKVSYMADASRMLVMAVEEIVEDKYEEN